MKTTTEMAHELSILTAAVADHAGRIGRARDTADTAAESFETTFGYHPRETPELCPGWAEAHALAERLSDEDGFYWAFRCRERSEGRSGD